MTPNELLRRTAAFALFVSVALSVAATHEAPTDRHFGLQRSSPAEDARVTDVDEVRLWFTQVPQENSASVRLVDSAGNLVETGDLMSDPDDGKIVYVTLHEALPNGAYTVAWRGIGDDGHVVRGEFGFTVAAQP